MGTGGKVSFAAAALLAAALAASAEPESPGLATVRLGGELSTDYAYRRVRGSGRTEPGISAADLSVSLARLRLAVNVGPAVSALFKINLQGAASRDSDAGIGDRDDEILEEAVLVLGMAGGDGWSFYAGRGRAPYGQDVTLGMLQSYHHSANRDSSPEGEVFIVEPPGTAIPLPGGGAVTLPEMRPGQLERVFMAGVAYERGGRWRAEVAAFQPGGEEYAPRLSARNANGASEAGLTARLWWRPIDGLTLEASLAAAHSSDMGRRELRIDLPTGAVARKWGSSLSLGFDWRLKPWRLFGEYQHGWNWNFSRGHAADIWQLGLARDISEGWRIGGMAETMRLASRTPAGKRVDSYYKLALNVGYAAASGWYALAEYGGEWFRRREDGAPDLRKRGDFLGLRVGLSF